VGWVAIAWAAAAAGTGVACHGPQTGLLALLGGAMCLCGAAAAARPVPWLAVGLASAFVGLGAVSPRGAPSLPDGPPGPSVAGRVAGVRPMPEGRTLTLRREQGGTQLEVHVPRTGEDWLDRGPVPRPGDRVRILVRPNGTRPGRATALCGATVALLRPAGPLDRAAAFPARARQAFQQRARGRLVAHPRDRVGGLLMALVTGRKEWLAHEDRQALRWSGLAHLAVVSGLHVGLIVLGAGAACRVVLGRAHRLGQLVSVAAGLAALVLLPATPPVRRATFALLLARSGAACGRGGHPGHALAVAAIVLLAVWPELATSWSFALTVGATAAILLAVRWRGPWAVPVTALAPFLATWPLLVWMTGRVSPWGPLANALAAPAVPLALAGGWLQVLLPEPLAVLTPLARLPARWVLAVGAESSCWPGSGAFAAPVGPLWVAATLAALATALSLRWTRVVRGAAWLVLASLWAWPIAGATRVPAPPGPSLCMLDVGQGQALLLRGRSASWLIDTGSGWASRWLAASLAGAGSPRLTGVVLTHLDEDHAGGLAAVMAGARPEWVAAPSSIRDAPEARTLAAAAARRGIAWRWLSAGDRLREGRLSLRPVWPDPGLRLGGNPGGLVLEVRAPGLRATVLGDATREVETRLSAADRFSPAAVLIASHHGAREGTGRRVLRASRPRWVGISCGPENRFGHPDASVLARIEEVEAARWITARHGGVCWSPVPGADGAAASLRLSPLVIPSRPRSGVGGSRSPG
jgi:competence protein ComEC